jgi:hypothetical protein
LKINYLANLAQTRCRDAAVTHLRRHSGRGGRNQSQVRRFNPHNKKFFRFSAEFFYLRPFSLYVFVRRWIKICLSVSVSERTYLCLCVFYLRVQVYVSLPLISFLFTFLASLSFPFLCTHFPFLSTYAFFFSLFIYVRRYAFFLFICIRICLSFSSMSAFFFSFYLHMYAFFFSFYLHVRIFPTLRRILAVFLS